MLAKARAIIREVLNEKDKVLVGLSGGADSIALSHLLYYMGYKLVVVHINFHLRGKESDRDAQFVADYLANKLPRLSATLQTLILMAGQEELGFP